MKDNAPPPTESLSDDNNEPATAASPEARSDEADAAATAVDAMEAMRAFMDEAGLKDDPRAKVILQAVRTGSFHHGPIPIAYRRGNFHGVALPGGCIWVLGGGQLDAAGRTAVAPGR